MFLLVPAYPGCPGSKAVKQSLLLLLSRLQLDKFSYTEIGFILLLLKKNYSGFPANSENDLVYAANAFKQRNMHICKLHQLFVETWAEC